ESRGRLFGKVVALAVRNPPPTNRCAERERKGSFLLLRRLWFVRDPQLRVPQLRLLLLYPFHCCGKDLQRRLQLLSDLLSFVLKLLFVQAHAFADAIEQGGGFLNDPVESSTRIAVCLSDGVLHDLLDMAHVCAVAAADPFCLDRLANGVLHLVDHFRWIGGAWRLW